MVDLVDARDIETLLALSSCTGAPEEGVAASRWGEEPVISRVAGASASVAGELFRDRERLDLRGGGCTGVAGFGVATLGLGAFGGGGIAGAGSRTRGLIMNPTFATLCVL